MPHLRLWSSVSALSAIACESLGENSDLSVVCRQTRSSRAALSNIEKNKNECSEQPKATKRKPRRSSKNDLEQYAKAHGKQPDCWSRFSVRSGELREPRPETGV